MPNSNTKLSLPCVRPLVLASGLMVTCSGASEGGEGMTPKGCPSSSLLVAHSPAQQKVGRKERKEQVKRHNGPSAGGEGMTPKGCSSSSLLVAHSPAQQKVERKEKKGKKR